MTRINAVAMTVAADMNTIWNGIAMASSIRVRICSGDTACRSDRRDKNRQSSIGRWDV